MNKPTICVTTNENVKRRVAKLTLELTDYDDIEEVMEVILVTLACKPEDLIIEYENIPHRLRGRNKLAPELYDYVNGWYKCDEDSEEAYLAYCDYFDDYSYLNFHQSYIGTERPDDYDLGLRELEDNEWIKNCPKDIEPYLFSLIEAYGEDVDCVVENNGYYFYDDVIEY